VADVVGLRRQITDAFLTVLQQAVPTLVDDGGNTRTLDYRGASSTDARRLPSIEVMTELPDLSRPLGGRMGSTNSGHRGIHAAIRGGLLDGIRITCRILTASEDEREQLSDLIQGTVWAGRNASHVPWTSVFHAQGIALMQNLRDDYSTLRATDDTGSTTLGTVYVNALVFTARSQFTTVPTPTGVNRITLVPKFIAVPPLHVTTSP